MEALPTVLDEATSEVCVSLTLTLTLTLTPTLTLALTLTLTSEAVILACIGISGSVCVKSPERYIIVHGPNIPVKNGKNGILFMVKYRYTTPCQAQHHDSRRRSGPTAQRVEAFRVPPAHHHSGNGVGTVTVWYGNGTCMVRYR